MCQGFSQFSGFLHHLVMAKLAISSINNIRVKYNLGSDHEFMKYLDKESCLLESYERFSIIYCMKNAHLKDNMQIVKMFWTLQH